MVASCGQTFLLMALIALSIDHFVSCRKLALYASSNFRNSPLRATHSNCQISDMINPQDDGYASYQSIYYLNTNLNTSGVLHTQSEFNCDRNQHTEDKLTVGVIGSSVKGTAEDAICNQDYAMKWGRPPKSKCPVTDEDIEASSSLLSRWPLRKAAFCNLDNEYLNNIRNAKSPDPVRVVFIGGSETKADYVQVQCCIEQPSYKKCAQWDPVNAIFMKNKYYCSWSGYFARWIQMRFPNKSFEFFNIAQSGTSSFQMAGEVESRFDDFNLTSLNSNDIIFLDHSSNEIFTLQLGQSWQLELLIRNIYSHFLDSDPPTIVLLEQVPKDGTASGVNFYTHQYRKVGHHYGLPIFSFNEAINSDKAKLKRPAALTHILSHFALHLPYSTHLFMADMLAMFTEKLIHSCGNHSDSILMKPKTAISNISTEESSSSSSLRSSLPLTHNTEMINNPPSAPTEEFSLAASNFRPDSSCMTLDVLRKHNLTKSTLAHFVPLNSVPPVNLNDFETKLTGWTKYTDRHQPGWIINKYAFENNKIEIAQSRLLLFKYPIDQLASLPNSTKLLIRVTYLKTYQDAGAFSPVPCGSTATPIFSSEYKYDTIFLYGDRKVSLPYTKSFVVTVGSILSCPAFTPNATSIAKGYSDYENDSKNPKGVYFGFHYVDPNWSVFSQPFKIDLRKNYKVKINSVSLCISNDNTFRT